MVYTISALRLKSEWMKMPVEFFEPLTFGELKVGQNFIALPLPGDNDGHGGFRGTHHIFTKTHQSVDKAESARRYGILGYRLPGRAIGRGGIVYDFDDSMLVIVILVE